MYLFMFVCFFGFSKVMSNEESLTRNVSAIESLCYRNSSDNSTGVLFHTKANSTKDVLHYVLTTWGMPSLLVAKTDTKTKLEVNCSLLFNNKSSDSSIRFSKKPQYVYGVLFNKLYEYDDVKDHADLDKLDNTTAWNVIDLSSNLNWTCNITTQNIFCTVPTNSSHLKLQKNGSLDFKFHFYGKDGEADYLPHQQYNANTTQVELILDNLLPQFNHSRYALELSLFSNDSKKAAKNELKEHKSIDDEHTPGVFELVDWTVEGDNQSHGAYIQWKPVCYTWNPASIKSSTMMKKYSLKNETIPTSVFNLAHAYFGSDFSAINIMSTNVSFGLSKDKFYELTNYTAWNFNIGYGHSPEESISILIILIISIGLGIPVILMICGAVIVCIRKRRQRDGEFNTSGYTQIQ